MGDPFGGVDPHPLRTAHARAGVRGVAVGRRVSDAELPSRVDGALPRLPGDCERVGRYPLEGADQLGVTRAALEREMNDWDLAGPR